MPPQLCAGTDFQQHSPKRQHLLNTQSVLSFFACIRELAMGMQLFSSFITVLKCASCHSCKLTIVKLVLIVVNSGYYKVIKNLIQIFKCISIHSCPACINDQGDHLGS